MGCWERTPVRISQSIRTMWEAGIMMVHYPVVEGDDPGPLLRRCLDLLMRRCTVASQGGAGYAQGPNGPVNMVSAGTRTLLINNQRTADSHPTNDNL